MSHHQSITLTRDCNGTLIPSGEQVQLAKDSQVFITQALGGTYTVNVNGNLARIDAIDADALGMEVEALKKNTDKADGPVDEALIWEQLKQCFDPEIPVNIVDLGLIYHCRITPLDGNGNRVDIEMTLTAPGCGMGPFLVNDVKTRISTVPNVTETHVEMVFFPQWDQSMMSEAAKLQTGML